LNVDKAIEGKPSFPMTAKTKGAGKGALALIGVRASADPQTRLPRTVAMRHFHAEAEDRCSLRRAAELDVYVTDPSGLRHAVRLMDISEGGFSIRTDPAEDMERDRLYVIELPGLCALSARVIWSLNGKTGFAMCTPLHPATVQRIAEKYLYDRLNWNLAQPGRTGKDLKSLPPFPFD
jgi:hypothetical protein